MTQETALQRLNELSTTLESLYNRTPSPKVRTTITNNLVAIELIRLRITNQADGKQILKWINKITTRVNFTNTRTAQTQKVCQL